MPSGAPPGVSLRPLSLADAAAIAELAGDREIADTMISIPHPLPVEAARTWIADRIARGPRCYPSAVCAAQSGALVGYVALVDVCAEHQVAELTFWIGRPYWGQGYARAAARIAIASAFEAHGLNRLQAFHMLRNAASGHLLESLGFSREGVLRERVLKWGKPEDVAVCGLLRSRWLGLVAPERPAGR